jgi:AraC-like DNA-binding protein
MSLEILPDSLYSLPSIEVLLKNDKSSIVYKSLSAGLIDKKMYLSSVAILLVRKGKQIIQNYDGSPTIVTEKEIVILPKDLYVVSDFVTKENAFEAIVFFIDDELIKKFLIFYTQKDRGMKSDSKIIKIRSNSRVDKYVIALNTEYKGRINSFSQVEIKIIEFLLLLSSYDENKEFISSLVKPKKRRVIKEFMEANYCENLNIEDYASLTGRSVSTFNREFKRVFSTTPNKWLISERLKKSRELLQNTNISVTDVCLEVGYENLSHFISAYKKQYGVTPKLDKTKNND